MVEQCNNDTGTVEQRWWNSGTMMVEQWTMTVEQWKSDGGKVEQ